MEKEERGRRSGRRNVNPAAATAASRNQKGPEKERERE